MPTRKRRESLPQMPLQVLETVLGAWRKSTAKKATTEWLEKTVGCSPGSSRRYLSDLTRMGLVDSDGRPLDRALDCATAPPERAKNAFEAILADCYKPVIDALKAGELQSYGDLLHHLRRHGYSTESAAGNVARLFCHLLERAGRESLRLAK